LIDKIHLSGLETSATAQSRRLVLLTEKALRIIAKHRMKNIDVEHIRDALSQAMKDIHFNIYAFVKHYV